MSALANKQLLRSSPLQNVIRIYRTVLSINLLVQPLVCQCTRSSIHQSVCLSIHHSLYCKTLILVLVI